MKKLKNNKGKGRKNMDMKYKAVFFLCKPAKSLFKGPQEVSQHIF